MNRQEAYERAVELVSRMTPAEKMSQLRYDSPEIARLGIPAYNWWNEALHGVARAGTATSFPQAVGMAAAFDEDLMQQIGDVTVYTVKEKQHYTAAFQIGQTQYTLEANGLDFDECQLVLASMFS